MIELTLELARPDPEVSCHWKLTLENITVGKGEGQTVEGQHPQLWWPAGQGDQPLYNLQIEVRDGAERTVGYGKRRIGLRTIKLDLSQDEWGGSGSVVW